MRTLLRRRHIFSLTPLLLLILAAATPRLSPNYYRHSCPRAERIVSDVIAAKQRANPSTAASTLRLFFLEHRLGAVHGVEGVWRS
jgi:peroxidase